MAAMGDQVESLPLLHPGLAERTNYQGIKRRNIPIVVMTEDLVEEEGDHEKTQRIGKEQQTPEAMRENVI